MNAPRSLYSLKSRSVISIATLCATLVVLSIYLSIETNKTNALASANQTTRASVFETNRLIRDTIWLSRESLDNYLLNPHSTESYEKFHRYLQQASMHCRNLLKDNSINDSIRHTTGLLLSSLKQLETRAIKLKHSTSHKTSSNTRVDHPKIVALLKSDINPLYVNAWHHILTLEIITESITLHDISALNNLNDRDRKLGIIATSLLIPFFIICLAVLDISLLSPIQRISRAMSAIAHGDMDIELPPAKNIETSSLILTFEQMREIVDSRQRNLEKMALHDELTGLPNRILFHDRVTESIKQAYRDKNTPAIFLIDLNRFKEINDTLGHQAGDALLKAVATRFNHALRASDTIARLGGDEFAILLKNVNQNQAEIVANKLSESLIEPIDIGGQQLFASASIGIALFPQHGETEEDLTKHADVAMYNAKRSHTGIAVYRPEDDRNSTTRLTLLNDLRSAIEEQKIVTYFQPQIDLLTQKVTGAEALLRWNHPEHGFVSPVEVIELAETSNLIKPLTYMILDQAMQNCSEWLKIGIDIRVSVNLSVNNLLDNTLVNLVDSLSKKHQLKLTSLCLEITETAMIRNPEKTVEVLNSFHERNIQISIDDFGTGYSSLGYLKRLPVNELKIDRTFISNITEDENDAIIVKSTIELAQNMGLAVVAEGIENEATRALLTDLKCDCAQGYYFARPMPQSEFVGWLIEKSGKKL